MGTTLDVHLDEIQIQLEPGSGRLPLKPIVHALRLDLSPSGFEKICRLAIAKADQRVPLDVELLGTELVDGGAIVRARAKKGLLRADVQARIHVTSIDPQSIRVTLQQLDAPVWVPTGFLIEHAFEVAAAKPGIRRVPGELTAVDIQPEAILDHLAIPAYVKRPGVWSVYPTFTSIGLRYQAASS
jgi:hypothetical protein